MYFRLPVLIVFIFAGIIGLMLLQNHFDSGMPNANGEPLTRELVVVSEPEKTNDKLVGAQTGLQTIEATDLQAHLEFLADDLLEGRDTGSRGARLAAMYIAAHFERLGLQAVGDHNTYYQGVPLQRKHVLRSSSMKIEIDGEMVPLRYGEDFLVAGLPTESGVTIEGQLVYSGFGITAPEYQYDDYENIAAENKIAVYVSGEPESDDPDFFRGDAPTRHSSSGPKRIAAQKAGALAAIGVVRDEQLSHIGWPALRNFLSSEKITLADNNSTNDESDAFPAVLVTPEVGELIFSREHRDYTAVDSAATAGATRPFTMTKRLELTIFFESGIITDNNVVSLLPGSDPQLKDEVVVLTAHYDHIGVGTPVAGDSIYNGAADNASGTSGLLELAEAFASLPKAPRRSLLFLAVTAEEKGLLGSEYYVNHPIFPLETTAANINLDMIGIGDTTALVVYGIERSTLGENIRRAAKTVGLEIWQDDMPEQRVFYRSDHFNFAKKGVPAIFPSFGIKREDFSEFTQFYHKPSDETDLAWLNYDYMEKHVKVVFHAALQVANSDEAPRWQPGDEFGKIRQKVESNAR